MESLLANVLFAAAHELIGSEAGSRLPTAEWCDLVDLEHDLYLLALGEG